MPFEAYHVEQALLGDLIDAMRYGDPWAREAVWGDQAAAYKQVNQWFNYFLGELRQGYKNLGGTARARLANLPAGAVDALVALLNTCYELPADWELKQGSFGKTWKKGSLKAKEVELVGKAFLGDAAAEATVQAGLRVLMHAGYKATARFEGTQPRPRAKEAAFTAYWKDAARLAWRGDTRPWADLDRAGGFIPKALSGDYAAFIGLTAPWNPFADPTVRAQAYWRESAQDNCVVTTISATPIGDGDDGDEFKVNITFPKIDEIGLGDLERGGGRFENLKAFIEGPMDGKARKSWYRTSIWVVGPGGVKKRIDPVCFDVTRIYLCAVQAFFDTEQKQRDAGGQGSSFDEIALRTIPKGDILGAVTLLRLHHGDSVEEGSTAVPIVDRRMQQTRLRKRGECGRFAAQYDRVKAIFDRVVAGCHKVRWTATGWDTPQLPAQHWGQPNRRVVKIGNLALIDGVIKP